MAQLNDLIVNGVARFLNPIQGNLNGNAATATTANTANTSKALSYTGEGTSCITAQQVSSSFNGKSGWGTYLICNHGNGTTYYHQMLRFDFFKDKIELQRRDNGTLKGWKPLSIFTEETPTTGQVVITDGTDGGVKSSGYTIAKSVPSDAVFTDHYAWSDITGKPSTFTPSSHNHSEIVTIGDQRSTATTPNDYSNRIIFKGLKGNSTIGSPSTDTYSYLVGLRGWSDSSGGNSHELAFNNSGIYARNGATTTWGSWQALGRFTAAPTTGQVVITDGTTGGIKSSGYTIAKSVPSNAVFTDTNNAVTQTATTTDADYEMLFSVTADNTTRTEGARKSNKLTFNPSNGSIRLKNSDGKTVVHINVDSSKEGGIDILNKTATATAFTMYSASGEGVILMNDTSGTTKTSLYGSGSINCLNLNNTPVTAYTKSMDMVSTSINANSIRENGIYGTDGGNITNCPSNWGTLISNSVYTDATQYASRSQMFITSGGSLYVRSCWDGSNWSTWNLCSAGAFVVTDISSSIAKISTNTTTLDVFGYKWGRVVYLYILNLVTAKACQNAEQYANGLPAPNRDVTVSLSSATTGYTYRMRVDTGGNLREWYNNTPIPSGMTLFGVITYISAS